MYRTHRFKLRVIDTPGIKEDSSREEMSKIINDYMTFVQIGYHSLLVFFLVFVHLPVFHRTYKPSAVVFVCTVEYALKKGVQTLLEETAKACNENHIPLVPVGSKVDLYDQSFIEDCVTPKKALYLMEAAALPKLDGLNWRFMHTVGCEDATVRVPFSVEAYGFEGSAYNVLTSIVNAMDPNNNNDSQETKQKDEL